MDIHKLSYKNSVSKIDKILKNEKQKLYIKGITGLYPIHIACITGSEKLIDLFLKYDNRILELKNDKGQTGYQLLAFYPKILENKIVNIHKDFNINTIDINGNNLLITLLVFNSNIDLGLLRKLKNLGASLSKPKSHITTLLNHNKCDLENKILEMFEYNLNDYDVLGFTPLYFMVKNNNLNCVKKILDKKININNSGDIGGTNIFELALRYSSEDMIKLLLNYEIDINYTNDYGDTYLHGIFLSQDGFYKEYIIEKLLKKVENFDIQNIDGDTIVHLMAKNNKIIKYIDFLKNKIINIALINKEGKTALDYLNKEDKNIFLKQINIKKENKDTIKYIKMRKVNKTLFTSYTRDSYLYILNILIKHKNSIVTFSNLKNKKLPDIINKTNSINKNLFIQFWSGIRFQYENFNGLLCCEINWNSKDLYFIHNNFYESIEKNLKKKDIIFSMVTLVNLESSHANILIIDNTQKTIERFDPYGVLGFNSPDDLDNLLEDKINKVIYKKIKKKYKYYRPKDLQRIKSFQFLSRHDDISNRRIGDVGGFCLAWCFWYLENRLNNLEINPKNLVSKLEKKLIIDKMDIIDYIRSYANKLHLDKSKLLNKFKIPPSEYYKILISQSKLINLYELIFNKIKSLY